MTFYRLIFTTISARGIFTRYTSFLSLSSSNKYGLLLDALSNPFDLLVRTVCFCGSPGNTHRYTATIITSEGSFRLEKVSKHSAG